MSILRSTTAALIGLAASAAAQAANHDSTTVPPVVIEATRAAPSEITTPSSITVIDRRAIEASGATHLVDVLRGQGMLQLHDLYGDGSRLTVGLRGFAVTGGSNTLVLIDGRRLNHTDIGAPDLNSISLENIERIEIIQGSAAVLYGDQAVGGVINIVTRRVAERHGSISLSAGSHDTLDLRATGSMRFNSGIGVRAAGQLRDSDNYRDHNRLQYRYGSLLADYRHAAGRLFAELQLSSEELELPGGLTRTQAAADRRQSVNTTDRNDTEHLVARLGISQRLADGWQFESELAYRNSDIDGVLELFGDLNTLVQQRDHLALTPRLVGSLPLGDREALLILGLDLDRTDYLLDGGGSFSRFVQDADQRLTGVYAQLTLPVTDRVTLTAGGRYTEVDNELFELSEFSGFATTQELDFTEQESAYELGFSFQANPELRLFARHDTPFRFAKVDENAYVSPGVTALEAQTGRSTEIGIEWQRAGRQLKLVAYRLDLDHEIGFDPSAADPFGSFTGANVNFDPTRRDGVLLEGRLRVGDRITLGGQYSYTDATFRAGPYRGEAMPMVATHSGRLLVELAFGAWHGTLEGVYTGERHLDGDFDGSRDTLGGHTVANLNLAYRHGPWRFDLRVDNLADQRFDDYGTFNIFSGDRLFPAPERRLLATARYHLG